MLALRWREAVTLFNAFLGVVLIIITGVIVGRFADVRRTVCDGGDVTANSATQADGAATILDDSARFWSRPEPNVNYRDMLVNLMDAGRLEENSRYFSRKPHIAGSRRQKETADELATRWQSYGFDKVEMPEYQVLLSFPQKARPNTVTIYQGNTVVHRIGGTEKIAEASEGNPDVTDPFLGYSPDGMVETRGLVFANYGREEDFERLNHLHVDVTHKIFIMKYGKIFRGAKVVNAARCGAVGALLYPDPADYAQEGYGASETYPQTPWLPGFAALYGSIGSWPLGGDPLTPGLPSIQGMHRRPISDDFMPPIPAQPIGYHDAAYLLGIMGGDIVPGDWKGGLNITYTLGPMFLRDDVTIELQVNNKLEQRSIYNVIGTIYGREEPDRLVILGNHRDAWVFGAADPVSGTATTTELARGLGQLLGAGWRPRRTIKICSWGGEEFALIGSVEWVEQHTKILDERAVVYLNFDTPVGGNFVMQSLASPLMKDDIWQQSKSIRDPNAHDVQTSIYDVMLERRPSLTDSGQPLIGTLGAGADYAPFFQYLGIPSADFRYFFGHKNESLLFPLYHTKHDTFNWMKTLIDPGFELHKAMAQFSGSLLLHYSDSPLLSLNVSHYVDVLDRSVAALKNKECFREWSGGSLAVLERAIGKFTTVAKLFEDALWNVSSKLKSFQPSPFAELRRINNQMMRLERAFVHTYGLPGRPLVRHMILAPSRCSDGAPSFPAITDALCDVRRTGDWEEVERQISLTAQAVLSAAEVLAPYDSV